MNHALTFLAWLAAAGLLVLAASNALEAFMVGGR
jgi:hypothetical protein